MIPLNMSNSQTALKKRKGKKALNHILEQTCCSDVKKHEGQVALMLLTLVRVTGSASCLSYLHGQ